MKILSNYLIKNRSYLKKVGLILLVIILITSFFFITRCSRDNIIQEKAKLETSYKFLKKEYNKLLRQFKALEDTSDMYVEKIETLHEEAKKVAILDDKVNKQNLQNIEKAKAGSNNSSYAFLQNKHEPDFKENFEFLFTGGQVKSMHITELKLVSEIDKIKGIQMQLDYCNQLLWNTKMHNNNLAKKVDNIQERLGIQKELFNNKEDENNILLKELRKKKFWNSVYKGAIIVGGTCVIVSSF